MCAMKTLIMKSPLPIINSERVVLKKHTLKQAPLMFDYVKKDQKRLQRFLPWPKHIKTVKDEVNFIKTTHKWWKEKTHFDFGIFRKSDQMYMGNIGIHSISWNNHRCEIGYWILGDFEGQGYMSEAVRALEGAMFRMGFHRIEIRCSTLNKRSANVPRACGYTHEGTLREDGIDMGKFRNTMVFGKLKKEWNQQKRI